MIPMNIAQNEVKILPHNYQQKQRQKQEHVFTNSGWLFNKRTYPTVNS
jgi:hypothetical protein